MRRRKRKVSKTKAKEDTKIWEKIKNKEIEMKEKKSSMY
jgi:hypothetical protein